MHAQIALAALPCIANVAPHEAPSEGAVKQLLNATMPLVHSELAAHASSSVGHIIAVHEAHGPEPAPAASKLDGESGAAFASRAASLLGDVASAASALPASFDVPLSLAAASLCAPVSAGSPASGAPAGDPPEHPDRSVTREAERSVVRMTMGRHSAPRAGTAWPGEVF